MQPWKNHEEIKCLEWEKAVAKAKQSAADLTAFHESRLSWKLPINIVEMRAQFELLCEEFDNSLQVMQGYSNAIDRLERRRKQDEKKGTGHINKLKQKVYNALVREQVPKSISKDTPSKQSISQAVIF